MLNPKGQADIARARELCTEKKQLEKKLNRLHDSLRTASRWAALQFLGLKPGDWVEIDRKFFAVGYYKVPGKTDAFEVARAVLSTYEDADKRDPDIFLDLFVGYGTDTTFHIRGRASVLRNHLTKMPKTGENHE